MNAEYIINKYNMKPLPNEGGFYSEVYKSSLDVEISLSQKYRRKAGSAILYLITQDNYSLLHKLKHDEIFHFYIGDPVQFFLIDQDGNSKTTIFSNQIDAGGEPQLIVRAGVWQGLRLVKGGEFAFMGTNVFPGFEYDDFELGDRKTLIDKYPHLKSDINSFTR